MEMETGNTLVVACTCHGKKMHVVIDNSQELLVVHIEDKNFVVANWDDIEEDDVKPLSREEWEAKYCPRKGMPSHGPLATRKELLGVPDKHCWSVQKGGETGEMYIIPGISLLYVEGYLVSEEPYEEAHGHVMGRWKMEPSVSTLNEVVYKRLLEKRAQMDEEHKLYASTSNAEEREHLSRLALGWGLDRLLSRLETNDHKADGAEAVAMLLNSGYTEEDMAKELFPVYARAGYAGYDRIDVDNAAEVKKYMRCVLAKYPSDTVIHNISATTASGCLTISVTRTLDRECEVDIYRYGEDPELRKAREAHEAHEAFAASLGHGGKSGDPSQTVILSGGIEETVILGGNKK